MNPFSSLRINNSWGRLPCVANHTIVVENQWNPLILNDASHSLDIRGSQQDKHAQRGDDINTDTETKIF